VTSRCTTRAVAFGQVRRRAGRTQVRLAGCLVLLDGHIAIGRQLLVEPLFDLSGAPLDDGRRVGLANDEPCPSFREIVALEGRVEVVVDRRSVVGLCRCSNLRSSGSALVFGYDTQ
jgi:hypothetical protein